VRIKGEDAKIKVSVQLIKMYKSINVKHGILIR